MSVVERHLRLAARLAWRGAGRVEPNPMVGCVIARGEEILGLGHHRVFGGPHAEIEALASCRRLGRSARGASVFVTLEPCAHVGKTGACATALIEAGVSEVVAAAPDPGVESGGGFARLEAAGIPTRLVREPHAARVGAPFVKRATAGLPWVICKWAQTIDGYSATRTGESQWVSGERSRRLVHRLRGRVDAVLVGAGTVRADDPSLTARGVRVRRVAVRAVIDTELSSLPGSRLEKTARETPVVAFCSARAAEGAGAVRLREAGVEVASVETDGDGRASVRAALAYLANEKAVTNVLCEAGGRLTSALVRDGLADELLVFTAPMAMGDPQAQATLAFGELSNLASARRFELRHVRRLGGDVMSVYGAGSASRSGVSPGTEK